MRPFLKLVIPEKAESVLFISLSLVLLVLQNIKLLWLSLGGNDAASLSTTSDLSEVVSSHYLTFEANLDPRIADFIVWMLVGSIVFALFSYLMAVLKSTSDEVELVHYYRSPKGRAHEVNVFISKFAMRAVGVFGLLVWTVLFLKSINPTFTKLFFTSVTTLNDPASWLWLGLSIVVMAIALYVFAICARIIVLRPRVFGSGEEI